MYVCRHEHVYKIVTATLDRCGNYIEPTMYVSTHIFVEMRKYTGI